MNVGHIHHYFESKETKNDRAINFHRVRGSVKVLSAVIGASVVVAMGAVTVAYPGNEVGASAASPNGWRAQQLPGRRRRRHLRRPSPPHHHRHPMSQEGDPALPTLIALGS